MQFSFLVNCLFKDTGELGTTHTHTRKQKWCMSKAVSEVTGYSMKAQEVVISVCVCSVLSSGVQRTRSPAAVLILGPDRSQNPSIQRTRPEREEQGDEG